MRWVRRTHRTVTESNGASELDEVTGGHRVLGQERDEVVDRVVNTVVSGEERLDGREKEHRAVSSSTAVTTVSEVFVGSRMHV